MVHSSKPVFAGRLLCTVCAAYVAGIAGFAFFSLPAVIISAIIAAVLVCAVFIKLDKLPLVLIVVITCISFSGGIVRFHIAEKQNDGFAEKYAGRYVTVSGSITDISFTENESQQIIVKTDSISALGKSENKPRLVCLYTDTGKSFNIGDKITFSDIFTPFDKTSTHSFDSETYFYTKSISASFSLSSEYIVSSAGELFFTDKIRIFSESVAEKIRSLVGGDEGEVAAAITLGDKSGFTDELTAIFSKSGISHIIAVSGMHLAILIGFFFSIASKTGLHYKIRNIIGIIIVLLYMTLTGFSPSVTRAGIMTICVLVASVFDRKEDVATSFFLSAAIILIVNPYTVCSAGFLLSYTSLAGILLFTKPLSARLKFLPGFVRITIATTLSATVTTLPVLAYIFNSVSIVSVVTNILVLPLVSIIFISVIIVAFLGFLCPPIASIFAFVPGLLIKFILFCAKMIAAVPYSSINIKSPGIVWMICYLTLAALLYFSLTGRKTGKTGFAAMSAVICVCAISVSVSALSCSVTFFDIGQGDCALIKLPGYHSCLIDTGPNGTAALSALKSEGINNLDVIFISHSDTDHSGALEEILTNFPTRKVIFPNYDIMGDELLSLADMAVKSGADVEFADRFFNYSFGGITADVLWPSGSFIPDDENDGSLVLKLDIKGNTFLFTGDIGFRPEYMLTRFADADVLKVAHHGSADSCSAQFLKAVSPRFSVISAGRNNAYGHPADETLLRLEKSGSKILRTDLLGDITFNIGLYGNMEVKYETD